MKVCYFGTYRAEYSRNQIMIEGLRQNNVEVIECHQPLWRGIDDRVAVTRGGWLRPAFWGRVISTYFNLLLKYRKIKNYDVMVVGYPGPLDVFLARLLTWLKGKPLVWDVFMSLYLIAKERKLDHKSNFSVQLIQAVERRALRVPDRLIQDTKSYVQWLVNTHGITPDRFRLVPTGADDRIFRPAPDMPAQDGLFHILYYGTFIPNHGVGIIMQAAEILKEDPTIVFDLVGDGPDRQAAEQYARTNRLAQVRFHEWMDQDSLVKTIRQSQVCLGAFGDTPQSLMTVQNKIYECMAMGKAVIHGVSPAAVEQFTHLDTIYFTERNPQDLAAAIRSLKDDPDLCKQMGRRALEIFNRDYRIQQLGAVFEAHLREILKK